MSESGLTPRAGTLADIVCLGKGARSRPHVVMRFTAAGEGQVGDNFEVVKPGTWWRAPGGPTESPFLDVCCPAHGWFRLDLTELHRRTHASPSRMRLAKTGRIAVRIKPD